MKRVRVAVLAALLLVGANGYAQTEPFPEDETSAPATSAGRDARPPEPGETPDEADPSSDPFDEFRVPGDEPFLRPGDLDDRQLDLLTREELQASGFEFGAEAETVDTSTALLLSVSVGAALHGVGHLYLGDTRTGFFLLTMEAVSVALMASSVGYYGLTEGASPAVSIFAPALQLGVATFIYSYLLDVIGTLRGNGRPLPENTLLSRGFGFRARYGLYSAVGVPLRSVIDASLVGDIGGLYASGSTTQDVFLDAAGYRGQFGIRPVRGQSDLTYLSLEANGGFFEWQGDGEFGRFNADGRVGVSFQIGDGYAHLDQFAIGGELGFGYHWYQFAPTGSSTFEFALSRPYVPFDAVASINLSEKLNVAGGYGSSDISLVPSIHRMLGIAHIDFLYRSSNFGDISLRTEIGDGFAVWLGGSIWLGR